MVLSQYRRRYKLYWTCNPNYPETTKKFPGYGPILQRYVEKEKPHLGSPITNLVGVGKKKLKWTEVHQKAFEDIKKVMAKETILTYLKFTQMPVTGNWVQLSLRMGNP